MELEVFDSSPIGIAHGIIINVQKPLAECSYLVGSEYEKQHKIALCDLEEIAKHLMDYVNSTRERYYME